MNGWSDYFYIFILGAALLLSVMGLWFISIIPGIDRWSKRFFLSYFFSFILCCITCLLEIVFQYYFQIPGMIYFLLLFLESLLLSIPLPMLTAYLLHCLGERMRTSRFFHIVFCLWAVYLIILAGTAFDGNLCIIISSENQYSRGPLYPLLLLPLVLILLLNIVRTIQCRKQLSRKVFLGFLTAMLPMTVSLIAQMFVDAFVIVDISILISALTMYGFVISDQIETDRCRQREIARQQLEIANQRASIMVLQMRPHFIYNTMTSIYCLCDQNPRLARQVVMDFTTYLRKNFTAIASSVPIPFSSELEHIRAYLAVEQALYEDSLFVDYDTPHIWFRVPPLTLQPIVENAVKHGRDPYAGPFHISIRTRKTDSGSEIVIADNGRGFDPADDSEPGIALKNIQQRLRIMCSGSLTITPNDGGGTVVTMTIPDSAAQ